MQQDWGDFLKTEGATLAGDHAHFGDPAQELARAARGDVLMDLTTLGLVRVSGADAGTFLSGQLTQDVGDLDPTQHRIGAYCTAQGRMLAILRVFRRANDYYALLPRALRDVTIERLRRYVMRAKVQLAPADDLVAVGIAGPHSVSAIERTLGQALAAGACMTQRDVTALHLPGPTPRFMIVAAPAAMQIVWREWRALATPVGAHIWDWLDIQAGLPTVLPQTVEAFVPQMANLDLVGGISLSKGCYPGQEIVARMHYLGRLKQRMYRARVAGANKPQPGDSIYAPLARGQSVGTVVVAHASIDGGFEMLVVLQIAAVETEPHALHWQSEDGPLLKILPLPYSLPDTSTASQ